MHSQSMSIPDCPSGWEEMWTGFSYLMVKFGRKRSDNRNFNDHFLRQRLTTLGDLAKT